MSDFNGVLKRVIDTPAQSPIDIVRRDTLKELSDHAKRNVIAYYSGFLTAADNPAVAISDSDMNGLMTVVKGLNKSSGLDLIIQSPGGDVAATEALGNYLRNIFNLDIRVFVPQLAMSGGTMIACIGKEIIMGKHSSIGPIDPQLNGIPAYNIIRQFEEAKTDISKNPSSIPYWQIMLSKFNPTFIYQSYRAVELSSEVLKDWLENGNMIDRSDKDRKAKINKIVNYLNNNKHTKLHARHINSEKAKSIGLKIVDLEDDNTLQDKVLSVHHAYMITLQNTNAVKIIENHNGVSYILSADSQRK